MAKKQAWGSRIGLILAMAGSAVGLGNFLRFPIQAVQNGGGAFIIPYLVSFVLLGLPLSMVEWSTGKFGGAKGHHASPMIMQRLDDNVIWRYIGAIGLFSSAVISSYYCFIESWIFSYMLHSLFGTFNGLTEMQISQMFDEYLNLSTSVSGIPYDTFLSFLFCLLLNVFILSKGVSGGIERVAKFCMPMLFLFGIFLVYKAFTLKAGENGAIFDGTVGLNFLWTPQFDSLTNPKVWLAAAGQVFFTMSLGMGAIQTYASYLDRQEDVALSSLTSAFTNEFTEVILGGSIIIPISIGYFGIDKVIEMTQSGGFGLGFRSMPYLFEQWGPVLSTLAGVAFFGLLFFSGITSTLSIIQPSVAYISTSYDWSQKKSSVIAGIAIFLMALPCVLFFENGVFDEYDYWAGTIALFLFATAEAIAFSWIMGVEKGWALITNHADLRIPKAFKHILKYVTPTMLIIIFISALIKPMNDDWSLISIHGWELDNTSIIGELMHKGMEATDPNIAYIDGARLYLLLILIGFWTIVYHTSIRRKKRVVKQRTASKL